MGAYDGRGHVGQSEGVNVMPLLLLARVKDDARACEAEPRDTRRPA